MTNIKITEKEREVKGRLFSGVIKPFGTSAHIPFKKEHMAKRINIIVPEEASYCWVLPEKDLQTFLSNAKKVVENSESKMTHQYLGAIKSIKNDDFQMNELVSLCILLFDSKKCIELIKKIRGMYKF